MSLSLRAIHIVTRTNSGDGMTPEQHVEHYRALGLSDMDAIKQTARDRGVPKGAIYGLIKKG